MLLLFHPLIGQRSIVMSVSVCVCVCLSVRDHVFGTIRPIFTKFVVHVIYGRGSVLLWRRSDMLCTSGFIDDVVFAHRPRLLDVAAQLKRSAHAALGLATNCAVIPVAGQRTHETTFLPLEVTSQAAAPGAESAVYDCPVVVVYISVSQVVQVGANSRRLSRVAV